MGKTKRILWDFKKIPGVNFIEKYGKLLEIIPKEKYTNFTKEEEYAREIDEARRDYAYFFLNIYTLSSDKDKQFFIKNLNSDDIKLLKDVVTPLEKVKTKYDDTIFDKKEAFDYFIDLFKKDKK